MSRQSKLAKRHRLGRAVTLLLTAGAAALTAGCEDYLERRDTITLGVGDSIAVNKATQTISRWPAAAREDRWLSDGERARISQSRYRTRTVPSPKTLETSGGESDILQSGGPSQTGAGQ
jgi:hypothetical protein